MATDVKKGITVKIDADLHAEVKAYIEQNNMTMADFITLAIQDELHPKIKQGEDESMEKTRTLAFAVPESLFQRIKEYLQRNNISQKQFVIGLIENELERDLTERQAQTATDGEVEAVTEDQDEIATEGEIEGGVDEETDEELTEETTITDENLPPEIEEDEDEEFTEDEESEDEEFTEDEEESQGFGMSM